MLFISWFHFESQTTCHKAPDTRLLKTETRVHHQKVLWTTLSACCKLHRFSHTIYMWHSRNMLNGDIPPRLWLTPILENLNGNIGGDISETSLSGCRTIGNMGSFPLRIIYLSISRAITDITKSILSPVNPDIIDSMLICIRGCQPH